jgi:RNA polymerase sigma-70 factor (ECF subfamily)
MAGWLYPQSATQLADRPGTRRVAAKTLAGQVGGHEADRDSGRATERAADQASDQAIAALVAEYAQPLYRVAFSVVRNAAEAEDAVQETFLRVLKNRSKLHELRDARVWLIRITWNVVLDRKRRSKTRPETDDIAELARTLPCGGPGSEAATIASAEYRRILALIDKLPAKEREALLLSAVEELTTAEIAAVLATSESSVRSRLYRARLLLARLLEEAALPPRAVPAAKSGGAR